MIRRLLLALSVISITGCTLFGGDEEIEPTPLADFTPSLDIRQAWTVKIGEASALPTRGLQPAHAAGRVFAAAYGGQVRAVDLDSGQVLWTTETGLAVRGGPGVGGDLVVVGTEDGVVLALDQKTGAELWRASVSSEVLSSPAVADGIVLVRAQDGRVFGFRQSDGFRSWVHDESVPLLSLRGNSSPLVADGNAYMGFDNGKVVALRVRDGSLLWQQTVAAPEGKTELERIVDIDGPLAVIGSELYAVTYQGLLAAMAVDSGRVLWVKDISSYTGVAVGRSQLNVGDSQDSVWGLDRISGGTLWRQDRLARRQLGAPARHSDAVVVGDFEGYLHWLSSEDGAFIGRIRAGKAAIVAKPLAVGALLIVQTQGGRLVAYRAAG